MQQAVLAECVYRTAAAVPLMLLTRAYRTADRELAASLTVFQVCGIAWQWGVHTWPPPSPCSRCEASDIVPYRHIIQPDMDYRIGLVKDY